MDGSIFKKFYQEQVDVYDFSLRKDNSHVPLNYAKLILAKYISGMIQFEHYANGRMVYW